MQLPINSVADLGLALRAVRRTSKLRLDDMASMAGVSKQFASDVELGKEIGNLCLSQCFGISFLIHSNNWANIHI